MRLDQDPKYTRIPGGGRRLLGPVQYWLAADHLLLVEVVGFVEKYCRFDLGQIEAMTVRRTSFRVGRIMVTLLPLAIFTALGSYLLLVDPTTGADQSASLISGAVSVAAALVSLGLIVRWLFLGRTCEVRLTTSLQSHFLPALDTPARAEGFCAAVLSAARRVQAEEISSPAGAATEPSIASAGAGAEAATPTLSSPDT